MTEPPAVIVQPEDRHSARAVASILVLTILLVALPLLEHIGSGSLPPQLVAILIIASGCYVLSRTAYYRVGGLVVIAALWVLPTQAAMSGTYTAPSFILSIVRLSLLALMFTYVLFSLRASLLLAGLIGLGFLLIPADTPLAVSQTRLATDFLLTAGAIFFVFVIARHYDLLERQHAQAAQYASEERYHAILESQTELICRWLPDRTLTYVNDACCRYYGISREEMLTKKVMSNTHPDDLQALNDSIASLTPQNPHVMTVHRVIDPTGAVRWQEWADQAFFDQNGKAVEYQSVGRDITELRQAQEAYAASEERYRAMVEIQKELICRWLPDLTTTFANEAYCRYFHKTREEMLATPVLNFIYPDDLAYVRDMIDHITREQPSATYEHRVLIDGEIRWHEWTDQAIFDTDGQIVEYQSVGRDVTELKRAEASLSASEERYRAIVEAQTEMVCRWLPDLTLTYVNDAYCRYYGLSREALIGTHILDDIHPDDIQPLRESFAGLTRANPHVTNENRMIDRNGEVRWHQWTDQAIFDEDGQIVEYQSVGRDVTELKRAEAAEREQRQFAEALSITAATITSSLDLDEVLERILNQVALVSPLNSAELMLIENGTARVVRSRGNTPEQRHEIMHAQFVIADTPNLRQMMETGKPIIIPDALHYPGWINFEASNWIRGMVGAPIRLEGETIGFLCINSEKVDAFNQRHAARLQVFADHAAIAIRNARMYGEFERYASQLEESVLEYTVQLELERQRLSVILDGTGEGIFYTEDEKIQYANLALCKLTDYTQTELIGEKTEILRAENISSEDLEKLRSINVAALHHDVWRGEVRLRRKDGSLFDAGLTVAVLGDPGVKPLRSVTVVRDISREKLLHQQRSNLVAYASHELRTPITNMKTRLYLLRRRPEALDEHLIILDEVTERMHHLVEDLLNISRLEHGLIPMRQKAVVLQEVVRGVVALQAPEAERRRLDLVWTLPDEEIEVFADEERLVQVITNLVTNALNYTPPGGSIEVVIGKDENSGRIEVIDTGIGIAPEDLPHIFEPFYRVISEVEGTGLGLSIVKEIVDLHGGTIDVRSEVGQGSRFTIRLPLLKALEVS